MTDSSKSDDTRKAAAYRARAEDLRKQARAFKPGALHDDFLRTAVHWEQMADRLDAESPKQK